MTSEPAPITVRIHATGKVEKLPYRRAVGLLSLGRASIAEVKPTPAPKRVPKTVPAPAPAGPTKKKESASDGD